MSQGYDMQKHRADGLKGQLDKANAKVAELEAEVLRCNEGWRKANARARELVRKYCDEGRIEEVKP